MDALKTSVKEGRRQPEWLHILAYWERGDMSRKFVDQMAGREAMWWSERDAAVVQLHALDEQQRDPLIEPHEV